MGEPTKIDLIDYFLFRVVIVPAIFFKLVSKNSNQGRPVQDLALLGGKIIT